VLGVTLAVLALGVSLSAQSAQQCLIVRSAEGHRFRNSMIAGALTGGIGFVAGAAFSGAKYEYADSFNMMGTKPKYNGKELTALQSQGVHVVVVNKKTASAEMESARNSCKSQATPATAPQTVAPAAPSAQAPKTAVVGAAPQACAETIVDAQGNETCAKQ
jgi:hypothetical protein